jgi:hypothetical protein
MILSGESGSIGGGGAAGGGSWGTPATDALSTEQPAATTSAAVPEKPRLAGGIEFVEWFGMNLGAGVVSGTQSYGRIDLHFATLNWPGFYYTVLEANVFPFFGMAGVGGRLGVRMPMGDAELRLGGRLGFSFWERKVTSRGPFSSDTGYEDVIGADITPHAQYIRKLEHGTIGVGMDIPILFGVGGHVAGGLHVYFRWSVF